MRMRNKFFIFIIVSVLVLLYTWRVCLVNANVYVPPIEWYSSNEDVLFTKDYDGQNEDPRDGYSVNVSASEIMSAERFRERFPQVGDEIISDQVDDVLLVDLILKNNNHSGDHHGVSVFNFSLIGTNYYAIPSPDLFMCLNPDMPDSSFALRPGTEMEITLLFEIIEAVQRTPEQMEKDMPRLQILAYPVKKQVLLPCWNVQHH